MRYGIFSYNRDSPKGGMFDMVDCTNSINDAKISALSDYDTYDTIYIYDFLLQEHIWVKEYK